MNIASGYVVCAGLSVVIALTALHMIWLGIGSIGRASEVDEPGKKLLSITGVALLISLALFWLYAWSQWPY
jgi:hypothetical protein